MSAYGWCLGRVVGMLGENLLDRPRLCNEMWRRCAGVDSQSARAYLFGGIKRGLDRFSSEDRLGTKSLISCSFM